MTVSKLKLWRDTYYTQMQPSDGRRLPDRGHRQARTTGQAVCETSADDDCTSSRATYLCLGDNSPESSDGRAWGLVPERLMLGRALLVYYPFAAGHGPHPADPPTAGNAMTSGRRSTIRVRYAETDRMGLLHHANYLVYFEQGRTELLRSLGRVVQGPGGPGLSAGADEGRGALPPAGPLRRPADGADDGGADDGGADRPPLRGAARRRAAGGGQRRRWRAWTAKAGRKCCRSCSGNAASRRNNPLDPEGNPPCADPDPDVLPLIFCLVPLLAAGLRAPSPIPAAVRRLLPAAQLSQLDWLILGLGAHALRPANAAWPGGPCSGAAPASTSGPTAGCRNSPRPPSGSRCWA